MDYKLITYDHPDYIDGYHNTDDIEKEIVTYLNNGWELYGNLIISKYIICQAMIKGGE